MCSSDLRKAAAMLGMSVSKLTGFASGADVTGNDGRALFVATKLPGALALWRKLGHERQAEFHSLNDEVNGEGLRAVARRLCIDPSNLRRKLKQF